MFDIGWSEMALVLLVALLVIGPKDLPKVARTLGRWAGKARAMAREFQRSFEDMAREAELDDIRKELHSLNRQQIGLDGPDRPSVAAAQTGSVASPTANPGAGDAAARQTTEASAGRSGDAVTATADGSAEKR